MKKQLSYKTRVFLFCLNNFFYYFLSAAGYCYLIPYLTMLGFAPATRSLMFTIGSLIAMLFQPIIGYLCDKFKTIKKFAFIVSIIYSIVTAIIYLTTKADIFMHFALTGLAIATFRISCGMLDNWIIESGEDFVKNFGLMRAFGSIGWAFASSVTASLIDKHNYQVLVYVIAASCVVVSIVELLCSDAVKEKENSLRASDIKSLFKNNRYVLLIVILFGIFTMQSALDITIVDKFAFINASEKEINYYWTLTAILEMPLFFLGAKLKTKFKESTLLLVAAVIYSLRFFMYSAANDVATMLIISTLQALSFPVIHLVCTSMINKQCPDNLKSTGQQVALALYSSLSALVSPMLAGILEQYFDINFALLVIGFIGIASVVLILLYRGKEKSNLTAKKI